MRSRPERRSFSSALGGGTRLSSVSSVSANIYADSKETLIAGYQHLNQSVAQHIYTILRIYRE